MNSTSCLVFQSFSLTTHTHAAVYDSQNLVINAFSSGLLGAWLRINKVECTAEVGLTVLPAQCTSVLSFGFPTSQGNAEALDR